MNERLQARIEDLERERLALEHRYAKVDFALANGTITDGEYQLLLFADFQGLSRERAMRRIDTQLDAFRREVTPVHHPSWRPILRTTLFGIIIIWLIVIGFIVSNRTPSGLVTYELSESGLANATNFSVPLDDMTSLRATGTLLGEGSALLELEHEGSRPVVTNLSSGNNYIIRTDQQAYHPNDEVVFSVSPAAEAVTYYVYFENQTFPIGGERYIPLAPGTYQVDAIITAGTVVTASIAFEVIPAETPIPDALRRPLPRETVFVDACLETCELNLTGDGTVLVVTSGGAVLDLSRITMTERENTPPAQVAPFLDLTLTTGAVTLDLVSYFADPDGDKLSYEINNMIGVEEEVRGQLLTLSGTTPGVYTTFIYASDGKSLVESNAFRVIVPEPTAPENGTSPPVIENQTNVTAAVVPAEQLLVNGTNETVVTAPAIVPVVADCSNTDPNARPLECLDESYFQDQTILFTSDDLAPLARLTPIGNLLLKGDTVEGSAASPAVGDYMIGYEDGVGVRHTTIWFAVSGDLHLRGRLYEENANLVPPDGSSVLRNKRGVVLAWADVTAGDLYVRGNVLPYHKSFRVSR